ncbi:hypothetical protein JNUCC64_21045 [Streptomyces sp. JNUCC 64]
MSVGTYFPGRGTIIEETFLKGETEGRAKTLVDVLEMRGLTVTPEARERITTTTDAPTLTRWLATALTATTVDELFTGTDAEPPAESPGDST